MFERHFRKVAPKTLDCWWDPRLETRDLCHRWDLGPETQDLEGGTRDPRLGTLNFRKFSQFYLKSGVYD